jgi:undecaprenyl-diphosphatase
MENQTIVEALLLGLLEGLTEFIPVSSTGHILLAGSFPRLRVHRQGLRGADPARRDPGDPLRLFAGEAAGASCRPAFATRAYARFVLGVLIAFLPAAVIGALAHDFIKTVLFETPMLICIMLILGGFVLLFGRPRAADAALYRRHGFSARRSASRSACSSAWR